MTNHACWVGLAGLFLGLLSSSPLQAAPPTLKAFYPPAASIGESVTVEAEGTFAAWPVNPLVDRPGLRVEAAEKQGQFKVTVEADAKPGIYRIRVADEQGVSAARPFLVGVLPSLVEQEPNDASQQAQAIAQSAHVCGKLQRAGDVDGYRLTLRRGQTLVAGVEASQVLGSPMDPVLQVSTPAGFVLAQNDDERGMDPLIVFPVPEDGDYLVRIFAFPATPNSSIAFAGGADFTYRLTLTTDGWLDHALPLAVPAPDSSQETGAAGAEDTGPAGSEETGPAGSKETGPDAMAPKVRVGGWNIPETLRELSAVRVADDSESVIVFHPELAGVLRLPTVAGPCLVAAAGSREQPQEIPVPATISGQLSDRGAAHAFRFPAQKAQPVRIRVESYGLGFALDPLLEVLDESGKVLSEVDDVSQDRDASLLFRAPADGNYRLVLRDLHGRVGPRFVYRVTLEPAVADYRLSVDADAFNLEAGKPLEVTVKVERRDGYAHPIQITAHELPDGVSVEPATSEPKGDSSKQVTLKLTAQAPLPAHPFRIRGQAAEDDLEVEAKFADPSLKSISPRLWLAASAGK